MVSSVATSIDSLFSAVAEEKKSGEIKPLTNNFYQELEAYISTLEQDKTSETVEHQIKSFQKLLASMKQTRKRKILIYLAYNKKIPSQMPKEEEELYNQLNKILNGAEKQSKVTRLKILEELPEIITPKGSKIGPFKQNEIVELLDDAEISFILANKIGETI